ncbi:zinc finger matrin-type protein 3-like [Rhagoletis pomonella]|uniref:zinc finger matrin-type protein 3-like n=1 Tax=Rhagoletis pomonella TaxID=28610 RepID=UPI00177BDF7F|nr:zinc finger matrin-type protein 3-like [Rhagoletis pomonella]
MSYDFLAGYHIPTIQHGVVAPMSAIPPHDATHQQNQQQAVDIYNQYQNINRYIPPGLQGTNYVPPLPSKPQKRKYDSGPGRSKLDPLAETTLDGKLVIFHGRDTSYPDELNKLIHPLHCSLCDVQMNSSKSAKDHYESKQHDRHITTWLNKNFVEKGQTAPIVKRFIKDGPTGTDIYHCEICDLKFGSLAHASQHYSGRKHKLVASKVSQPSGAGFYNTENKWVRTGTKYVPKIDNDGRFGIGSLFQAYPDASDEGAAPDTTTPTDTIAKTAISPDGHVKLIAAGPTSKKVVATSSYCEICKVHATSEGQMTMHLEGVKHKKKLKSLSLEESIAQAKPVSITPVATNSSDTILESLKQSNPTADLSMYRTPSGSYYCECCNISMCHVAGLQQHLIGKKHLKKVNEVKEKAKNEAAKIKNEAKA